MLSSFQVKLVCLGGQEFAGELKPSATEVGFVGLRAALANLQTVSCEIFVS
jgi:hypothetical protein